MLEAAKFSLAMEVLKIFNQNCDKEEEVKELLVEVWKLIKVRWATLSLPQLPSK